MAFRKTKIAGYIGLASLSLSGCIDDGKDGLNGVIGVNGFNSLITQTSVEVGSVNCFNGGVQIDSGIDLNRNQLLEANEIDATEIICNSSSQTNIASLPSNNTEIEIEQDVLALPSVEFSFDGQTSSGMDLKIGIGSGAYHYPNDPENIFYTISDRGPNIKCTDAEDVIGIANFCVQNGEVVKGKIFPIIDFSPSIYKWEIIGNSLNQRQVKLIETISLKDSSGQPISGLPNNLTFEDGSLNSEVAFDKNGNLLAFDNQGIDPESLVKLSDGSFWISEEYGVSLLHIASDGKVLERVMPQGMESQITDANYNVSGELPAIYHKRKLNRGIESIAVSPDESYLYFIMQSPLENPDYKRSRHVRVMKYALNNGDLGAAVGEYVYQIDRPESFTDGVNGDINKKQKDVKVSEMFAIDTDELVVLERISKTTKLYRINLNSADNILSTSLSSTGVIANESEEEKTLEDVFNLSAVNAQPVNKQLIFNSMIDGLELPKKIEGLAWMSEKKLLVINDDDFGISGDESHVFVLDMGNKLTSESAAVTSNPQMTLVGRYQASSGGEGAAEIVGYHDASKSIFAINGDLGNRVETVSLKDLTTAPLENPLTNTNLTGIIYDLPNNVTIGEELIAISDINSLAIYENRLAVAIAHNNDIEEQGVVLLYDLDSDGVFDVNSYTAIRVGVLPDNLRFSPDGKNLVVANEAQAGDDPEDDQKGSISIIKFVNGVVDLTAITLYFDDFNNQTIDGINQNPQALDFAHAVEPEYVAISNDSLTAYVTLQEINAIAKVDLESDALISVTGLGFKDHSKASNSLDASDKDDKVNIRTYENLYGMYQPDTIQSYQSNGKNYLITANEGDAGDGFQDVDERVEDLSLNADAFPNAAELQTDDQLGRLKVVPYLGQNESGEYEKLYAFGARSFSIWDENAKIVFDSGNDFEKITAGLYGIDFNNDEDDNDADTRSDAKGPEPEALAVGNMNGKTYAFIGFERMGGIAMYDISNPYAVQFLSYTNNRDFTDIDNGDLAPEGMSFVAAEKSPTGVPLLIVGNEISGTVAIYQVK